MFLSSSSEEDLNFEQDIAAVGITQNTGPSSYRRLSAVPALPTATRTTPSPASKYIIGGTHENVAPSAKRHRFDANTPISKTKRKQVSPALQQDNNQCSSSEDSDSDLIILSGRKKARRKSGAMLGRNLLASPSPAKQASSPLKRFQFGKNAPVKLKARNEEEMDEPASHFLLAEEPARVAIPAALNAYLRDYQRDGVQFMADSVLSGKGCVLGDDMGLGKTVQVVALLVALKMANGGNPTRFLVVGPLTCLEQWQGELKRWGQLSSVLYHGTRHQKKSAIASMHGARADVLLTSYDTFSNELATIEAPNYACVIFDEVHRIKNEKTKICIAANNMRCLRRIGLTGTLMQNDLKELFTIMHWARPGIFGTPSAFQSQFATKIKQGIRRDATGLEVAHARRASKALCKAMVGTFLRRDKKLLKDLLPEKSDNIVFCPLSAWQQQVYDRALDLPEVVRLRSSVELCNCGRYLDRTRRQCCDAGDSTQLSKDLLVTLSNLQKISNHIYRLMQGDEDDRNKMLREQKYAERVLGQDNIAKIRDAYLKHDRQLSGKMAVLAKLLPEWQKQKSRVLLFASSTKMLDILERDIVSKRYQYLRLDGSVPAARRQSLVNSFNRNTRKFIFLISTKVGGVGLNMCSANIVCIFDPAWNGAMDAQAMDRAYRLGQTRDTFVYRFVSQGSIEEVMYMRQVYKTQLANASVHNIHEKRYFSGVQGVKGEEGDLFGLVNLLTRPGKDDSVRTGDIIKNAEAKYKIVQSKLQDVDAAPTFLESILTSKLDDVFVDKSAQIDLTGDADDEVVFDEEEQDPVQKMLMEAGVTYSHRTEDILGKDGEEEVFSRTIEQTLEAQNQPKVASASLGTAHIPQHYYNNN